MQARRERCGWMQEYRNVAHVRFHKYIYVDLRHHSARILCTIKVRVATIGDTTYRHATPLHSRAGSDICSPVHDAVLV
jgi:hypothetical protein